MFIALVISIINQSATPRSEVLRAVRSLPQIHSAVTVEYKSERKRCKTTAWPYTYHNSALCYAQERQKASGLVVYITPTFTLSGARDAIGGFAVGSCKTSNPFAVVYFNARSQKFRGKLPLILAHEIGHLLTAQHTSDRSIMNADALNLLPLPSEFSRASRKELERCL